MGRKLEIYGRWILMPVNKCCITGLKVGPNDLDNVGHLDGSHPQTKLSGCDPNFLVATLEYGSIC